MDVHLPVFALNKKIRTSFNALYSREREADELLYIEWNSRMRPTNMLCRLRSMKFRQQKWSFERTQIKALKCFLDTRRRQISRRTDESIALRTGRLKGREAGTRGPGARNRRA